MSQTRGRNAGYRDKANNQRQPHHLAKPNFGAQSSSKAPAREPAATASIIKTRSFQFLVNAVGAENIALGLDSNLTRVAELMKGERFTPETAFHMETTLGLPHGFFDQHHPVLAPELITRLKSPLEFVRMNEEVEEEAETQAATSVSDIQKQSLLASGSSEEAKMASKTTKGALSAVKTSQAKVAAPVSSNASAKGAASARSASRQAPEHQPPLPNDAATVERIRRANLHVLTSRNGSKVKLGVVMGLSGSNMAHRLHGKKRMDDTEANRFTERLGLPGGWLDTPRSEAEIPASVSLLLSPTARARALAQKQEPPAAATNGGAPSEPAPLTRTDRIQLRASDGDQSLALSAGPSRDEDAAAVESQDLVDSSSAELADRPAEESDAQVAAVMAAPIGSPPALTTSQVSAPSPSSASATSLHGLDGIAPIAEALLKTLAGKARTGRLDELKALELLQRAVLL